jgi:hypothetical protein
MLTTNALRKLPVDGTVLVGYDDLTFEYWGMIQQADGSVVVHLQHADAGGGKGDIEVAKQDLDEPYWEE